MDDMKTVPFFLIFASRYIMCAVVGGSLMVRPGVTDLRDCGALKYALKMEIICDGFWNKEVSELSKETEALVLECSVNERAKSEQGLECSAL